MVKVKVSVEFKCNYIGDFESISKHTTWTIRNGFNDTVDISKVSVERIE